eukprot:4801267-Pyramimonas_sp.AAC.1
MWCTALQSKHVVQSMRCTFLGCNVWVAPRTARQRTRPPRRASRLARGENSEHPASPGGAYEAPAGGHQARTLNNQPIPYKTDENS